MSQDLTGFVLRFGTYRSQFHQHFKRALYVQNFGAKNYKAVFWV